MAIFDAVEPRPPDAILGLSDAFRADPRPGKISLAVGVYVDESGRTPVLDTVRDAEARILEAQTTKVYKPIAGDPAFIDRVRELVFGADHPAVLDRRVEALHTPGGTGALRVAGELLRALQPDATMWLPEPTWPNHPQVFSAAGFRLRAYPYLADGSIDLDGLLTTLRGAAPGDVVVLHGCCHNPTGIDPTLDEWQAIADVIEEARLLPLVDFAYQGFADGLRPDAAALRHLIRPGREALVASSFSKNFGLYDERVGALGIVGATAQQAAALATHAEAVVRASYSNPPAHGGEIVATILGDDELRARWEAEVRVMRERINANRRALAEELVAAKAPGDHSRLLGQRGMFSLLGLDDGQVARLRDEFAVYVVARGRVNVAGLTRSNIGSACRALALVMARG